MSECNEYKNPRWTIISVKIAVVAFVIIVLKIWSEAMTWVQNTNIWWFVAVFVIFAVNAGMHCENSCCVVKSPQKKSKRKGK